MINLEALGLESLDSFLGDVFENQDFHTCVRDWMQDFAAGVVYLPAKTIVEEIAGW